MLSYTLDIEQLLSFLIRSRKHFLVRWNKYIQCDVTTIEKLLRAVANYIAY